MFDALSRMQGRASGTRPRHCDLAPVVRCGCSLFLGFFLQMMCRIPWRRKRPRTDLVFFLRQEARGF